MYIPKVYMLDIDERKSLTELVEELNHIADKYGDNITYKAEIMGGMESIIPSSFNFFYSIDVDKVTIGVIKERLKLIGAPELNRGPKFPYSTAFKFFNVFASPTGRLVINGIVFDNGKDCAHYMESVTLADFYEGYLAARKVQAIANKKGHMLTEENHETV